MTKFTIVAQENALYTDFDSSVFADVVTTTSNGSDWNSVSSCYLHLNLF